MNKKEFLTAVNLISSLSGDLLIEPSLLVETIQEDADLRHLVRSYGAGDFTYEQVLDTLKDVF